MGPSSRRNDDSSWKMSTLGLSFSCFGPGRDNSNFLPSIGSRPQIDRHIFCPDFGIAKNCFPLERGGGRVSEHRSELLRRRIQILGCPAPAPWWWWWWWWCQQKIRHYNSMNSANPFPFQHIAYASKI